MKNDIAIKVVTKSVILDKIEWRKRVYVADPNQFDEDSQSTPKFWD